MADSPVAASSRLPFATADRTSLHEPTAALRDLVWRAASTACAASKMSDPTITVTGLGESGVEAVQVRWQS